ncbi:IS701 family transposase [Kitasatospora sp. NPDC101801]|uniref:IS701 family transposase n=1 Tax=Kitasatospora sp. NPDC101801 TaxID=3364103 RepID=UPI003807B8FE
MATIAHLREAPARERHDGLSDYCRELFACFARTDQRRWGEVYLRGLLHASGRRTPANITEQVLGRRVVQPIQQFVSQSTWDCDGVRRHLAERVSALSAPQAWAFDEVAFQKNGTRSVGVARQFVPSAGRTMNCQLALATSLVHAEGSLPVNWRLLLPREWDTDQDLRAQAHLPEEQRHQSRDDYLLESLDQILEWDVPRAPVLADWSHGQDIEPLLAGLEQRGLSYLIAVGVGTQLTVPTPPGRTPVGRMPAGELARALGNRSPGTVLGWQEGTGRVRHSRFMATALVGGPVVPPTRLSGIRGRAPRNLVVEWPFGRPQPRTQWVTNLTSDRLPEVAALAALRHSSGTGCERLQRHYGLADFEGRSFRGWHHHVTLASAALGFHTLRELEFARRPELRSEVG